jgi:hypothetical protein
VRNRRDPTRSIARSSRHTQIPIITWRANVLFFDASFAGSAEPAAVDGLSVDCAVGRQPVQRPMMLASA